MSHDDYADCLAIPPLDPTFFSDQPPLNFDLDDDVFLDDHDFDFTIDELLNDSFDLTPQFTNSQSPTPENQLFGSEGCGSNKVNSVTSSPGFDSNLIRIEVDECVKNEGVVYIDDDLNGGRKNNINNKNNNNNSNGVLKRKTDSQDSSNSSRNEDVKHRRSSEVLSEEEKMKVRLMRNRESAHLSRQRKKQYVGELEGKVRSMHSTIQDLNAKIAYIVAENASLKQQIGGGVVPSSMGMQPGMYPPPGMMYPWMPMPPYMVNPHGSQVPLVPIPRLKSQQLASAPKPRKKTENKKGQGRTKKVASVSFLGLLFFMLLFGGLVPMVNVRYGGMKDSFLGRSDFVGNGHYEKHHGRVLAMDGETLSKAHDTNSKFNCGRRDPSEGEVSAKNGGCGIVGEGNSSEPLMASLYVPRNDKLVKIDGNLIIHSILASEKATKPGEGHPEKTDDKTGLALLGDSVPSDHRRNHGRHPHLALGSGDERKTITADHQLQQWFREGLAGPMLSSGKCTEVFQFDVISASTPGAIITATSARNVSTASSKNSTHVNKGRNRRILHGLPIPLPGSSAQNMSEEGNGRDAGNGKFSGTNSSSSMVVSVLMDPREAADAEVDGVMRVKSLSRIFVVVLIDGVKYVTYSCMFPFKGAAVPHLVTA